MIMPPCNGNRTRTSDLTRTIVNLDFVSKQPQQPSDVKYPPKRRSSAGVANPAKAPDSIGFGRTCIWFDNLPYKSTRSVYSWTNSLDRQLRFIVPEENENVEISVWWSTPRCQADLSEVADLPERRRWRCSHVRLFACIIACMLLFEAYCI
jgi:hypothetical protein